MLRRPGSRRHTLLAFDFLPTAVLPSADSP